MELQRSKSLPLTRSRSGSLIRKFYRVEKNKIDNETETVNEYVKNMDGAIAKLVNHDGSDINEKNPYHVEKILEVLNGSRFDYKVVWVYSYL